MTIKQKARQWVEGRYYDATNVGQDQIDIDRKCGVEDFLAGASEMHNIYRAAIDKWANDNYIMSPTHDDSYWQNRLINDLRKVVAGIEKGNK